MADKARDPDCCRNVYELSNGSKHLGIWYYPFEISADRAGGMGAAYRLRIYLKKESRT